MKCANCNNDISTVGEVRSCGQCQRNGTAGGVHASFRNEDPVEYMVAAANPGAFPFTHPEPEGVGQPAETAQDAQLDSNPDQGPHGQFGGAGASGTFDDTPTQANPSADNSSDAASSDSGSSDSGGGSGD